MNADVSLSFCCVSARVDALIEQMDKGDVDDFEVEAAEYRAYLGTVHADASSSLSSPAACLALVRLFAFYHTMRRVALVRSSGVVPPRDLMSRMETFDVEQREDFLKAWAILQQPRVQALHQPIPHPPNAVEGVAAALAREADPRLLALEIAQRLKSGEYMRESFNRLMETLPAEMSTEQLMASCMTAPLLGRWREMRTLGERLIDRNGPDAFEGPGTRHNRALADREREAATLLTSTASLTACCPLCVGRAAHDRVEGGDDSRLLSAVPEECGLAEHTTTGSPATVVVGGVRRHRIHHHARSSPHSTARAPPTAE